jgi:hypothetical protein
MLTICAFFITSYFAWLIPYFFFGIDYGTRQSFQEFDLSSITLRLNSIFTFLFLFFWYLSKNNYSDVAEKLIRQNNPIIFVTSLAIVIFFALLMLSDSGNAYTSNYREVTENRYAFIDYSLVLIVLAFAFSMEKMDKLILFVIVFYCAMCILYGYRLRFLQMSLLTFLLFGERRFSSESIFKICLFGFLFLLILGVTRGLDKTINIMSLFGGDRNGVIISNQGGVFLNATMYIGLVEREIISYTTRLTTFLGNFIGIFYSQTALPIEFNLVSYLSASYSAPGGGLIVGYLYVWGGYFSVIAVPLLISRGYNRLYSDAEVSQLFIIYWIVILFMFPRWFAYNPLHLIKMPVIAVLAYLICIGFNHICKNISKVN